MAKNACCVRQCPEIMVFDPKKETLAAVKSVRMYPILSCRHRMLATELAAPMLGPLQDAFADDRGKVV